jgi:exonuclease VII large subunit
LRAIEDLRVTPEEVIARAAMIKAANLAIMQAGGHELDRLICTKPRGQKGKR